MTAVTNHNFCGMIQRIGIGTWSTRKPRMCWRDIIGITREVIARTLQPNKPTNSIPNGTMSASPKISSSATKIPSIKSIHTTSWVAITQTSKLRLKENSETTHKIEDHSSEQEGSRTTRKRTISQWVTNLFQK